LYKNPNRPGFVANRVFRADALFIRTKNTVGARSAQVRPWQVTIFKKAFPILK
jgi:hypothetical protein